ncbi:palmitoyltransferase for Vac8p [Ceratobasidium sp. 392]|nr:palmitoyltransferase for Vac8p [Ceratobasidium sp. 392]
MPLLTFPDSSQPTNRSSRRSTIQYGGVSKTVRRVFRLAQRYGPAIIAVALVLSAFPSMIIVTTAHHYKIDGSLRSFIAHIVIASFLNFVTLSSFIVCVTRDPGPVAPLKSREDDVERNALFPRPNRNEEEISLADALAGPSTEDAGSSDEDSEIGVDDQGERSPRELTIARIASGVFSKWTITAHGWQTIVSSGHRTYPSFLHFLLGTTLIAAHAVSVSVSPLRWYFNNSMVVVDLTPLHALYLALGGAIFTICMGSFVGFHIYLVTTGQTTLEQLSPYMLLRYLPPPSSTVDRSDDSGRSFESDVDLRTMLNTSPDPEDDNQANTDQPSSSSGLVSLPVYPPPGHSVPVTSRDKAAQFAEHTMTRSQRRLVRSAAGKIRIYDLGWRRNWSDMLPVRPERLWLDWLELIWWGGHGTNGDGKAFARNPKAAGMLVRLRERLDNE